MDEQQFDDLVKRLAGTSRRHLLSSVLGGLAAAVGMHEVDAAQEGRDKRPDKKQKENNRGRDKRRQKGRGPGAEAKGKAKKCGGKPCQAGNTCLTGRGKPVCCPDARVCGRKCLDTACAAPCQVCDPTTDACVNADGDPCDDGDLCTINDTCQNGACQPGAPNPDCATAECQSASDCLVQPPANSCQQATCVNGRCGVETKPAGESCDDGSRCTENDRCNAEGVCVGDAVTGCVACQGDTECTTLGVGQCEEAFCNSQNVCAVRFKQDGMSCDDDNPCTDNDQCTTGVCAGTLRENCVACSTNTDCHTIAVDPCHEAVCGPGETCIVVNAQDGTACDDGNPCTDNDACTNGTCVGELNSSCVACQGNSDCTGLSVGQCEEAFCNSQNVCAIRSKADGAGCDDGDPCTTNDQCSNGVCAGTLTENCVACSTNTDCDSVPVDPCERVVCGAGGTCTVENKPNGTVCDDGNACTTGETCQNGVCGAPTSVQACLGGPCQDGTCDPSTGDCIFTDQPNNTVCGTDRICCGGTCVENTTTTNCGSCGTVCDPGQLCCSGGCTTPVAAWANLTTFGSFGPGPNKFNRPHDIALAGDEQTIWVADADNHRISIWTKQSDGTWANLTTFGTEGPGVNQFNSPRGVAVAADERTVWVADTNTHRISVWTHDGTTWTNLTTFGSVGIGPSKFANPVGIAVAADGKTVWVADTNNHRISVWTEANGIWTNLTTFGSGPGPGVNRFDQPRNVTVSADGKTAWVADTNNHRISVWTETGGVWSNLTTFGSLGAGGHRFNNPFSVAVAGDEQTVWVADTSNHRVSIWTKQSDGTWANLTTFGSGPGPEANQFNLPRGVVAAAGGNTVWVGDTYNHRISIWTDSGESCPTT